MKCKNCGKGRPRLFNIDGGFCNQACYDEFKGSIIAEAHLPPVSSIMGIHSINNPTGNFLAKCKCGCGNTFGWDGHKWVMK